MEGYSSQEYLLSSYPWLKLNALYRMPGPDRPEPGPVLRKEGDSPPPLWGAPPPGGYPPDPARDRGAPARGVDVKPLRGRPQKGRKRPKMGQNRENGVKPHFFAIFDENPHFWRFFGKNQLAS